MLDTVKAAYEKDPALKGGLGYVEVLLYPGVQAILLYRIAHGLHSMGVPVVPRAISYFGRFLTGAEIHPAARIGKGFFIDHATGVVIGETAEIGDNVMLYHGVTLGGHGWWRDRKGEKRHPTLEDNVTVGVGATILGPVTVKKNSKVGALAVIVDDIPEDSTVVCPKGRLRIMEGCYQRLKDPCEACSKEPEWMI
ncbi:MAG: serine O-acetyltransferase [Candidatus Altiarchaeales archaeon]|nr:serine O-acetyltransferase [Candidatus Altiarchaeales archaeon]MBD3417337.1 serine O-acetyltransferase [Candidatus Altiarchaeales archaeon]